MSPRGGAAPPGTRGRAHGGALALVGVLLLLGGWGCYAHLPVDPAAAPPGEEVRVHLGGQTAGDLSYRLGWVVRHMEGRLVAADADSLALSIFAGRLYRGHLLESRWERHAFPRRDVLLVERREFQRNRTLLLGLGVVAAVAVVIDQARGGGGGDQPPTGNGPPPAPAVVPR